jgi:hypothetical protein
MAITGLLMGSTTWAEEEGPNPNKLKVGMVLTLEGVDAAGALYEQNLWVAGRVFLPFTEGKHFKLVEFFGDDEAFGVLGKWDHNGDLYRYEVGGSEVAVFVNGPVGSKFQYHDPDGTVEATVVSVGETVVVPAGTFYDCVQVEKHDVAGPVPSPPWIEWWKPGLFIVKWIDWWVPTAAPVEWELVSVENTLP